MAAPDQTGVAVEAQTAVDEGVLLRSFSFLAPHRRLLAAMFVVTTLVVLANLALPWLFGEAVSAVEAENESRVVRIGMAAIGVGVIRSALLALQTLGTGRLSIDIERSVRDELYRHLLHLGAGFHARQRVGRLVSRLMITSGPIRSFLGQSLPRIASDLLTVLFAAIAILVIDPRLALAAFWSVPFVIWLVARYGRRITPVMVERQAREADVTSDAAETLRGISTVTVLNAQQTQIDEFDDSTRAWLGVARRVAVTSSKYEALIVSLPSFAWAGLFALGGMSVLDGDLELGTLVTFLGYVGVMLGPIQGLGATLWRTQNATASAARVYELLDEAPETTEGADVPADSAPALMLTEVSQSYGEEGAKALDRVELDVAAGRNVVIVGPTGSGKSSLLALLTRLFDPDEGRVLLDERPIDEIGLAPLRAVVRLVSSTPRLFAMSIEDNLAYGSPDASREDIEVVTRALGLHARIEQFPDGYDTVVGDGGTPVREATAQWINIARALVTRPGILLLDDATAPLPPAREAEVVRGIRSLTEHTTVVAVANRPALLALADDVVVMEDGELVAGGTVEDLERDSAAFRRVLIGWRSEGGPAGRGLEEGGP